MLGCSLRLVPLRRRRGSYRRKNEDRKKREEEERRIAAVSESRKIDAQRRAEFPTLKTRLEKKLYSALGHTDPK